MVKRLQLSEMQLIGDGRFTSLYKLATAAGPRLMAARNSGNWQAAKCLLMYVDEAPTPAPTLAETLLQVGPANVRVLFLAVDRPITYFPSMPFVENYQLELPGGVLKFGESVDQGGLREAMEEAGVAEANSIVQAEPLLPLPCPWDAGAHVEIYGLQCALAHGQPKPPRAEGTIPELCREVPLPDALPFLLGERQRRICVEGHAITALTMLENTLLRTAIRQKTAAECS